MKKKLFRTAVSFFTLIAILAAFLLSVVLVFNFGPSKRARNLFVNSMLETSALKFLATWFFSEEELAEIVRQNSVAPTEDITDPSLISGGDEKKKEPEKNTPTKQEAPHSSVVSVGKTVEEDKNLISDSDGIKLYDISTSRYKGKLMVVEDPARVNIGICGKLGYGEKGMSLDRFAEAYNAIAVVNGGGFEDEGGLGSGSVPLGLVISGGELMWGNYEEVYDVIGFTAEHVLVVGTMTAERAMKYGVCDAMSFGPVLIVNGKKATIYGNGSGLNPRTAIGQRADGAVLLLVIDGRQAQSLGATLFDVSNVLYEYGAVNAANLDGGNSSAMYYDGKVINSIAGLALRAIPTAVYVKRSGNG